VSSSNGTNTEITNSARAPSNEWLRSRTKFIGQEHLHPSETERNIVRDDFKEDSSQFGQLGRLFNYPTGRSESSSACF
jgi:hypothetical protein